jgi:hypothetical protein
MSGCAATYNGDVDLLPHVVVLSGEMPAGISRFLAEEARGHYDLLAYSAFPGDSLTLKNYYKYRFSDPDTAFWFRIKFG